MGLSDLIAGGMEATAATELLLNVVWTIVGATLVYFMQAGFATVSYTHLDVYKRQPMHCADLPIHPLSPKG